MFKENKMINTLQRTVFMFISISLLCGCNVKESLADFSQVTKDFGESLKIKSGNNNSVSTQANTSPKVKSNTAMLLEVDGISIGDDMSDVLSKLGILSTDLQITKINFHSDMIEKHNLDKAKSEWHKVVPQASRYEARKEIGNASYGVVFDHNKKLLEFGVTKVYKKHVSLEALYKKIENKYGKRHSGKWPTSVSGKPISESSVDKLNIQYQNAEAALTIKVFRGRFDGEASMSVKLYFMGQMAPKAQRESQVALYNLQKSTRKNLEEKYRVKATSVNDVNF